MRLHLFAIDYTPFGFSVTKLCDESLRRSVVLSSPGTYSDPTIGQAGMIIVWIVPLKRKFSRLVCLRCGFD